jgi:structural maintenance of chromosome 3 (chondroitin sulfate proteoglycan 6)
MYLFLFHWVLFIGKSLVDVRNKIDQLKASVTNKQDEMGTELIDHLTPLEKYELSQLN